MDQLPPKTGKFALNYGLLLAGISIVFSLMLYFMDLHTQQNPVITIVGIAIIAVILFMGIQAYKKANEGFLTVSQAVKVGLGTSALAAVIILIYQLIFTYGIEPDFADQIMELRRQQMMEGGELTTEQVNQQIEMGKKYFWMGFLVIMIFNILIGLVISWIEGLILKKSRPEY